jgi:hypothetical protein
LVIETAYLHSRQQIHADFQENFENEFKRKERNLQIAMGTWDS